MKAKSRCARCDARPEDDKERLFIRFTPKIMLCEFCLKLAGDVLGERARMRAQGHISWSESRGK